MAARSVNWTGIIYVTVSCVIGAVAAYFGQPLIHNNDRATNVIVTLFSVLAGFLVAIITLVGDPTIYTGRTWRVQEVVRTNILARLTRQKWLFIVYLLTLGTIFVSTLIPCRFSTLIMWCERLYLALTTVAFLISVRLPGALVQIQIERHDAMIAAKKGPSSSGSGD